MQQHLRCGKTLPHKKQSEELYPLISILCNIQGNQRSKEESVQMASVDSAVSFLLGKLETLLTEEVQLLKGVRAEARKIKEDLESMKAFLVDADAKVENDEGVKLWVKEVREAAYDIEDVFDEFVLRLAQEPDQEGHGFLGFVQKSFDGILRLKSRHQIADKIQVLRNKVADISRRRANFGLHKIERGQVSITLSARVNDLRMNARFSDKDDLVGTDRSSKELIQWLVEGEARMTTISLIGMGGLGKTTLAGKVYGSEEVKKHFDCHAWVTVSASFSTEEIFRRLIKEFCGSSVQGVDTMDRNKLIEKLQEFLPGKRYVIVFDDIWKKIDWDSIKTGLPVGKPGSRILVTTRMHEVADALDQSYKLKPLSEDESFQLFCKKAFQPEFGGTCPLDLVGWSKKMVKRCDGLPLAVVAVGGLLSSKPKTPAVWQNVYNSLEYEIVKDDMLAAMKHILLLSFNDLPHRLKSCFSYVSIFPEDYLIKRKRLINLWVAEGFVETVAGKTFEDVADDYLEVLINRSLIQVVRRANYGTVITCRVHDLVREIIVSKSREENFVTSLAGQNMELSAKPRRLSIHSNCKAAPKVSRTENLPQLRSFFMFDVDNIPGAFINCVFPRFKYLKVLDLEDLPIKNFPSDIVDLFFLRLLSLKNTKINKLPPSIGNLINLETLDIRGTDIKELTPNVLKLKRLRHLLTRTNHKISVNLVIPDSGLENWSSLQTLFSIAVHQPSGRLNELQDLVQLRKLGIDGVKSEDGVDLCASILKMPNLSALLVSSREEEELNLQSLSSPPQFLQHLHLRGRLKRLPDWVPSLSSLIRLRLESSQLKEDPLRALQHLTSLMELELSLAYDEDELCCDAGGFPALELLHLSQLYRLKKVTLGQGAMPRLQKLWLYHCSSLQNVPFGIEHLNLRELKFSAARDELKKSIARDGGEDHWKISRIPLIKYDQGRLH